MTEQRDNFLESLFDAAEEELSDDAFTSSVVEDVQSRRRRILFGRLAVAALLVMLELLLDSPLQHSLGEMLGTPLYPIDHDWLAFVVTPINTVAGLVGLILLGLHFFYRRIAH